MMLPDAGWLEEYFGYLEKEYNGETEHFNFYAKLVELSKKEGEVSHEEVLNPILDYIYETVKNRTGGCLCCLSPIFKRIYERDRYIEKLFDILYENESRELKIEAINQFYTKFQRTVQKAFIVNTIISCSIL